MNGNELLAPQDVYDKKALRRALNELGDYVYGYYRSDKKSQLSLPFYVGKGKGSRVLQHWENAIRNPIKQHEETISSDLKKGNIPIIKLLAYNLEDTEPSAVNSVAERVLQDAFGIQKVWEKRGGHERVVDLPGAILQQTREDSSKKPVLSLEAVMGFDSKKKEITPHEIANQLNVPVLLVGLSHTYHPSYSESQLAEMARMYWNLESKFGNTSYPSLRDHKCSVLLAWDSRLLKRPVIVGAWRIKSKSFKTYQRSDRQMCEIAKNLDLDIRIRFLGRPLVGSGNSYQGPGIYLPQTLKS